MGVSLGDVDDGVSVGCILGWSDGASDGVVVGV